MIIEYHRPQTLDQALQLLARPTPRTYPLGGGSWLSRKRDEDFAVIDLQSLGLDEVQAEGGWLSLGATARLQKLVEVQATPAWLKDVCTRETHRNLREMSSIAGTLVGADGRSPIAMAMLAVNASIQTMPGGAEISAQEFFASRKSAGSHRLITRVRLDLSAEVRCEFVARTPLDTPVIGVALAVWPGMAMRIALGGFGEAPMLAYEGDDAGQARAAVHTALHASGDAWASAVYRQAAALAILERLL